MTQQEYHRTNIGLQLSKNKVRSLPPIPRPEGRFRANGSHQAHAADRLIENLFAAGFRFCGHWVKLGDTAEPGGG
jgi:hypothetical protein